jgi:hypothetical protein
MKFQAGISGNPGGLRREHRAKIEQLRDLCSDEIPSLVERLKELAKDTDGKVALQAIQQLLDRAAGKAAQAPSPDDNVRKLQALDLKSRAELAQARTRELQLEAEVEQLRRQIVELGKRAVMQ